MRARPVAALVACLLLAGCQAAPASGPSAAAPSGVVSLWSAPADGATPSVSPSPSPTTEPSPDPTPEPTPEPSNSAPPSPAQPDRVTQTLAAMTPDQKVGQLLMVALHRNTSTSALSATAAAGGVTGVFLLDNGWSAAEVAQVSAMLKTASAGQPVGEYLAADQEGGKVQRLSGAGFDPIPDAVTQGAWTPQALTTRAADWAEQLAAAGVNLNLAPVADTVPAGTAADNAPIGALGRDFGADPQVAGTQAAAFVAGMAAGGVQACVKHFPGLGMVEDNTDFATDVEDTVLTRDDPSLESFRLALAAHPAMVMVSLATYAKIDPNHLAAFSPTVVTGMLRGDLGWQGVVISDSLDAQAVRSMSAGQRATSFIAAGGDIALFASLSDVAAAKAAIKQRMAADPGFAQQVDQAVARVLAAKQAAGLLPA